MKKHDLKSLLPLIIIGLVITCLLVYFLFVIGVLFIMHYTID